MPEGALESDGPVEGPDAAGEDAAGPPADAVPRGCLSAVPGTAQADIAGDVSPASGARNGNDRPSRWTGDGRRACEVDLGPLPRRLGRYEVLEKIGSGGMGTVFRARQLPIDRIVALKVLSPDLARDRRYLRRFVREARAAGNLNHRNLVQVHDVGRVEGHPYICMEHVGGTSVERMLRERGRLAPEEAVDVAIEVARAIEYAHAAGVVHRDIKPDNILVNARGEVKLADLGLAKPTAAGAESLTHDGLGMGTPHYVALEQARDARSADARSDIYSLGATLYHMTTGRVPFDGDSPVDVLMHAMEDDLVDPGTYAPGLAASVSAVIARMMARRPEDRYQDAGSLLRDLVAVRHELAGLGPAEGVGRPAVSRPAQGAGDLLIEIAAALGVLVLAGAFALSSGPEDAALPPTPMFERQEAATGPSLRTGPPDRGGEAREAQTAATVDAALSLYLPHANIVSGPAAAPAPRTPAVDSKEAAIPGDATGGRAPASSAKEAALARSRWAERIGRYGEAAEALRAFIASTANDEDRFAERTEVAASLKKLYGRADKEAAATADLAHGLMAAGRAGKAVSLMEWSLSCWGLPLLEARAEDVLTDLVGEREALLAGEQAMARAEADALICLERADLHLRARRFRTALDETDKALAALQGVGAASGGRPAAVALPSSLQIEVGRRRRELGTLAAMHAAIIGRLQRREVAVQAGDVLTRSPSSQAVLVDADAEKLWIGLDAPGTRAGMRWEDLSATEYARLASRLARRDAPDEVMGAALAWLKAERPDAAMKLWRLLPKTTEDLSAFASSRGESEAVAEAVARSRGHDEAGREREALAALAPLLEYGVDSPEARRAFGRRVLSLAGDVGASAGLWASVRPGPGRAEEFAYDFSQGTWQRDWNPSGSRYRQAERGVVSPAGGACSFEFDGPFIALSEVLVSARFFEDAGAVGIALFPDERGASAAGSIQMPVEDIGRAQPLAEDAVDVVFSRSWERLSKRAVGRSGSVPAAHPRGPERLVVTLMGWVELRAVRVRGVVDPDWRLARRGAREAALEEAAALARGIAGGDERARALDAVRLAFPACRRAGLDLMREAAMACLAAGDRARAARQYRQAADWYPEFPAEAAACRDEAERLREEGD